MVLLDKSKTFLVESKEEEQDFSCMMNKLLDRPIPEEYKDFWTHLLMKEKIPSQKKQEISVVLFRLGKEWLALSTKVFKTISEMRVSHVVPHKSNSIFLGLVNIGGRLRMHVSMHQLLEIPNEQGEKLALSPITYHRMIVIEKDNQIWSFSAEEVHGIQTFVTDQITSVPVTLSKSTSNYLKGIVSWESKNVALLDEELLFYSLKRSLS